MPHRKGNSRKQAFDRGTAQRIAERKMYTAGGDPIHNLDAYLNAGGRAHNSAGAVIQNPRAYRNAIEASVRQNTTDPKYLYHYTTDDAAAQIDASGHIAQSDTGMAGAGTYLTAKPPRTRTDALLHNNYASSTSRNSSYVDQYVRVDHTDHLAAIHVGRDRDVWKVNGNVDLSSHNGFVATRSGKKRGRRTTNTYAGGYGHDDGDSDDEDDY
jgi:hypothetical protein